MEVVFKVNQQVIRAARDDRRTLTEYLRDQLKLKGTRFGCGQEECGACVVLVDGEPRYSCQTEVGNLSEREVETVESLANSSEGRSLLDQFERHQAGQCGFCLSGILMRAVHFVRHSDDGSTAAVAQALEPHLCRCGAHPRIVAAVQASWRAARETS
jgi:nicotinate dehydrogenase subunit A